VVAPTRGHLPEVAKIPIVHLEEAKINLPKLPVEPTMQIHLQQNTAMPKLGAPQSAQVALASQGSGSDSGFGLGMGGGIGQGHGTGMGPGGNGGYGGGLMNVGGGVSAPRVVYSVEPQFTSEARQADYQGVVGIQLIVDSQGNPQDVRVVRHLGMGLDERAIEAVKQYKFSPAIYQGHAVSVQMIIDVDFRLH
jgi:protein TonB